MQLTLKFPKKCTPDEFREHLAKAIKEDLPPEPLPPVCPYRICLHLDTQATAQMVALAARHQLLEKDVVSRLAYSSILSEMESAKKSGSNPLLNGTYGSKRKDLQDLLLSRCRFAVENKKIALLEASTGVGKSRVIGQALQVLTHQNSDGNHPKRRCWVVAPTVMVMLHLLKEFALVKDCPKPAMLLGKANFIEPDRSRDLVEEMLIEDADNMDANLRKECLGLKAWIENGGKPVSPIGKELSSHFEDGLHHLAEDAKWIAPSIELSSFLHFETEDEVLSSQKQRMSESLSAPFVLCTHAMLGCLLRADKFDGVSTLIVDEAHQLEETIANMYGGDLSLASLRSWLKKSQSKIAVEAIEIVTELFNHLQKKYPSDAHVTEDRDMVVSKVAEIHKKLSRMRVKTPESKEWQSLLARIVNLSGSILHVRFSPVRRQPNIIAGPATVHWVFEKLWKSLDSALLLSGTLFLPQRDTMSSAYMRIKMNIPQERLYDPAPLVSPWVMESPTLYYPSPESATLLCYPGDIPDEDEESHAPLQEWIERIVSMLRRIHKRSKGGILALAPAHRDVSMLQAKMMDLDEDLIVSKSSSMGAKLFNERRIAGGKPLWIATGPAWTGLSLDAPHGVEPFEDYHLSTLVLLRLPFNLNRTSTQIVRQSRIGFQASSSEALLLVRQGLGRLIRREGLRDRSIYVLDGRIWSKTSNPAYAPFRALLARYRSESFTI